MSMVVASILESNTEQVILIEWHRKPELTFARIPTSFHSPFDNVHRPFLNVWDETSLIRHKPC